MCVPPARASPALESQAVQTHPAKEGVVRVWELVEAGGGAQSFAHAQQVLCHSTHSFHTNLSLLLCLRQVLTLEPSLTETVCVAQHGRQFPSNRACLRSKVQEYKQELQHLTRTYTLNGHI